MDLLGRLPLLPSGHSNGVAAGSDAAPAPDDGFGCLSPGKVVHGAEQVARCVEGLAALPNVTEHLNAIRSDREQEVLGAGEHYAECVHSSDLDGDLHNEGLIDRKSKWLTNRTAVTSSYGL